jgi:hypothetical protein
MRKEKSGEHIQSFSAMLSVKKSVKNNGHSSPIFSLKNLKCSTSGSDGKERSDGTVELTVG